jgi:putative transposase
VEQNQVIKARHVILRVAPQQTTLLKVTQPEAARCWNDIVSIARDHYTETSTWIGKRDLQKRLKGGYRLHSQTIQSLTDKFVANRDTTANLRRQGSDIRYPWREKKFFTIPFKLDGDPHGKKRHLGSLPLCRSPVRHWLYPSHGS